MSNHWLLYDSGCAVCAALAREVEARSGGRLRVRSLREPMLPEVEGGRVRVFTGLTMRARLVQLLGPARALRVAQAVARFGGPIPKESKNQWIGTKIRWHFLLFLFLIVYFIFNNRISIAHNWNICGDGIPVRWYGTSTSHWWPTSWDSSYQAAIQQAASNFNTSDFDYYWAASTSALMIWGDLNYPDTNVAGATSIYVNCATHIIQSGSFYFNFPHFNASPHTVNQKTCTAIHELGHGAGFDHNSLYSILYADHKQRCHSWLITSLQTHDYQDINSRY